MSRGTDDNSTLWTAVLCVNDKFDFWQVIPGILSSNLIPVSNSLDIPGCNDILQTHFSHKMANKWWLACPDASHKMSSWTGVLGLRHWFPESFIRLVSSYSFHSVSIIHNYTVVWALHVITDLVVWLSVLWDQVHSMSFVCWSPAYVWMTSLRTSSIFSRPGSSWFFSCPLQWNRHLNGWRFETAKDAITNATIQPKDVSKNGFQECYQQL